MKGSCSGVFGIADSIPTIAVGAISEADHVNSIIAAGRADLCAVARPHLANPAWTLTEAARIGYKQVTWPAPYRSAKPQLEAIFQRFTPAVEALRTHKEYLRTHPPRRLERQAPLPP